nr:MAG TPA: hypothetical protein [Caudoviricetes sp.]
MKNINMAHILINKKSRITPTVKNISVRDIIT